MIRLGPTTSECEKNVTVVSTVSGGDVTNCATTVHGFNKQNRKVQKKKQSQTCLWMDQTNDLFSKTFQDIVQQLIRIHFGSSYGMFGGPLHFVLTVLMAELLVAELHGRLLRRVSSKRHYQGMGVAARDNDYNSSTRLIPYVDTSRWYTRNHYMMRFDAYCSKHDPPLLAATCAATALTPTTDTSHRATTVTTFNCRLPRTSCASDRKRGTST